ncbi:MAG TPA: type II secretion system protein GspM [Caulobacteraceae bacterium]|nr:type II secretion system protein GspM [Caulobacteraceae bacterium]
MKPLTARERRLVAIGLAVAAVAVLWLALVQPIASGLSHRAAERRELTAQWRRQTRLIAEQASWLRAARRESLAATDFVLPAPTEEAAVETLKSRLQRLAGDQGFQITGLTDLPAAAPPGFVRLRADMQLTLAQLTLALRQLETEDPYVVVEYLSVSADRALASGKLSPLDVRLEISAPFGTGAAGAQAAPEALLR